MNGEWGIWMGARDMDEVVETDEVGDGRYGWCQRVGIFFEIGRKGTKDGGVALEISRYYTLYQLCWDKVYIDWKSLKQTFL